MLLNFFVFNRRGEVLVLKCWSADVSRADINYFKSGIIASKNTESPIVLHGNHAFLWFLVQDVYVCATIPTFGDLSTAFEYMHRIVDVVKDYTGEELNEDLVRGNFVLIYEILSESCDRGHPQITEADMLRQVIQTKIQKVSRTKEEDIAVQATGQMTWRPRGIVYKANKLYLDVIEDCKCLISAGGDVLNAEIRGELKVNSLLSGMPTCRLGLNDRMWMRSTDASRTRGGGSGIGARRGVEFDDWTFHQCVRLQELESERSINFVPPDGKFTLMTYRLTSFHFVPFKIRPLINQIGPSRVEYQVVVEGDFTDHIARAVVLRIPVPPNAADATVAVSQGGGRARFEPENGGIVWRISEFEGDRSFTLTATVNTLRTSVERVWERPPISIEFKLPGLAASGLDIKFLKVVSAEDYEVERYARCLTRAGPSSFLVRTQ